MKTLNEQHRLIKEGKGHKGMFLKEAKKQFPQWIRNAATYKETTTILKNKGIINENIVSLEPVNQLVSSPKESYEVAFENFLEEAKKKAESDAKAEEKKTSKQVEDAQSKNFDRKDMENPDNLIFDQIMTGYYCELKNPKNSKKTMDELKKIVFKNLAKDPIHYSKKGQFGEEGVGYETELPGLGTPKEPKGPYKSSGYGTLKEDKLRKTINSLIKEELTVDENYEDEELPSRNDDTINSIISRKWREYRKSAGAQSVMIDDMPDEVIQKITNKFRKEAEAELRGGTLDEESSFENNLSQYEEMSDVELIDWAKDNAMEDMIEMDLENGLANRDEIIQALLGLDTPNTDKFGRWIDKDHPLYKSHPTDGNPEDEDMPSWMLQENKSDKHIDAVWSIWDKHFNGERNPKFFYQGNNSRGWVLDLYDGEMSNEEFDHMEMFYKEAVDYLKDNNVDFQDNGNQLNIFNQEESKPSLQESKFRKVVNTLVKQQIQENVQKELQQINKEAEYEVIASKLEKVGAAIEKRQSQLDRLDEDEDLKNLTDKKKLKALAKDIKVLEKAKIKMEKALAKKDKSSKPQPEIIDEDPIEEAEGDVDDAKITADELERAASAAKEIGDTELFEESPTEDILISMKNELESYVERVGNASEAVAMYLENHPEDESYKTQLMQLADPLF